MRSASARVASSPRFLASSFLLLGIVRPIARRHVSMPPQLRTGTAALVGETAVVLERISNDEGVGSVRLKGQVWTARAYDDGSSYEAGEPGTRHGDQGRNRARDRDLGREAAMEAGLIVLIVVAIFVLFLAARTVRIIPQARAGVVERLGRYSRTLTPGL